MIAEHYQQVDLIEKAAFKQWATAQLDFPCPGLQGPTCFIWDDTEEGDNGYLVRRPYGCDKADQEWYFWEKYHKRFDPWTRTWDIFPDPIPNTVLYYVLADSPNHPPPPSLPSFPEFETPYDFHRYDQDDNIQPTPSEDHDTPLVFSPQKDIDDDQVSLRDDLDTNLLEG